MKCNVLNSHVYLQNYNIIRHIKLWKVCLIKLWMNKLNHKVFFLSAFLACNLKHFQKSLTTTLIVCSPAETAMESEMNVKYILFWLRLRHVIAIVYYPFNSTKTLHIQKGYPTSLLDDMLFILGTALNNVLEQNRVFVQYFTV